jgi:elongator complex protein 5
MAPTPLQQRRTHNSLLFQKLLNLRDGASPFTLVLDSLEQSGVGIVREFGRRAKVNCSHIYRVHYSSWNEIDTSLKRWKEEAMRGLGI